jgi:2-isopropylmalate synthase
MKIVLYDTTLRDGTQTEGISLSVNDKLRIVKKLDELGIHFIEGGWPGSNLKDASFFKEARRLRLKDANLVAFGSTRRPNTRANKDKNLRSLIESSCEFVTIFGKSWDMHVKRVFGIPLDENLKMIEDSITFLKSKQISVFYDAEHFFDAYKANPKYAVKTVLTARDSGADAIILCDTNGGMLTRDIESIFSGVKSHFRIPLGIHTHNDSNLAVANSIAAVLAGASHVQGTINGYGERCGNADLTSIIPILKLKLKYDCLPNEKIKELTEVSRFVAEICNMRQQASQPFVGSSAFAHKGGVHINAVMKYTKTYEHIDPRLVGNHRKILVSEISGKSSLLIRAKELELDLKKESPKTRRVLKLIQELENKGYQFEAADGSFELLIKKALKKYKRFFSLEGFRVIVEKKQDGRLISEATIKVKVNKIEEHTASEGDGPVNALDNAIRKALTKFYPALSKMHLSDFKVRVLDEKVGTAAKVRVLIQSQDEEDSWSTIGVSENVIEASWQALVDSIEYKLLKDAKKRSPETKLKGKRWLTV